MAVSYGFFDSYENDRTYEAADFNRLFDGIISDGVFEGVGEMFNVTVGESGMMLIVGTGRAWFNNTWTYNDSVYPILIPDSETLLNRIDAIVLEVDKTNETRANRIYVISGEPSYDTPEKPTLKQEEGVYQYAIAYITVGAGVTELTEDNIEYVVGNEETPYVTGEIQQLDIENILLEWNSAFDDYFTSYKDTKQKEFKAFLGGIVNELTATQVGQLQADILNKEDAPTELVTTVSSGATTASITDNSINSNSFIDVYSDPFGLVLLGATQAGHTVNLTFRAVSSTTKIKILVRND